MAINIAIIAFYWWQGSGDTLLDGPAGAAIALGRLAGLAAAASVLLQFVFIGRTPWLERTFGLDNLVRIHKANGKLTVLFLLLHPLLLTIGYSRLANISLFAQFQSFLFDYERVLWAGLGSLLFLVVIITSLVIIRRRLRYETWYAVHLLVYLAVFASLWHQFAVGTDLLINQTFYGYWLTLYTVVFANHLVFRLARPLYLFSRHQFTVHAIERETHNVVSVSIIGRHLQKFPVRPGQFMIVRFLTPALWWQAHPFSLSKPADSQHLRLTIKELGDFTRQVKSIPVGTKVIIDGPYGIFTKEAASSPNILLIAGGIGITPLRSLMEEFLQAGRRVTLLYANQAKKDIALGQEVHELANHPRARIIHVLSNEPNYEGEQGYIDEEKLRRLVPDIKTHEIYLCGPPPMMDTLLPVLHRLGVPPNHIHFEKFSL